jgi:hypothetical protein
MGFKTAIVFSGDCDRGYLGSFPEHDSTKSIELLRELGWTFGYSRMADLDAGIYPPDGTIAVGAYTQAIIFSDPKSIYGCVANPGKPFFQKLLQLYPTGTLLVAELQSTLNHFGYALFENSIRVRAFGGSAARGIEVDEGPLLVEEREFFVNSRIKKGQRVFCEIVSNGEQEYTVFEFGEKLVFAVMARFLGESLEKFDKSKLKMELFARPWWKIW